MNKTDLRYTFPNGSFIEFFLPTVLKSAVGQDEISYTLTSATMFPRWPMMSLKSVPECLFLDFNPVSEFWAHEMQGWPEVEWIHSTYLQARHVLPIQVVRSIESRRERDPNWWRIYGLGLVGNLEGLVHPNFKTVKALPEEAVFSSGWISGIPTIQQF